MVQPPLSIDRPENFSALHRTRSVDLDNRKPIEGVLVTEGIHRRVEAPDLGKSVIDREDSEIAWSPEKKRTRRTSDQASEKQSSSPTSPTAPRRDLHAHPQDHRPIKSAQTWPTQRDNDHAKGHAHDPLDDHLFLNIGPGNSDDVFDELIVSESPPAADIHIYEKAYHDEVERIKQRQGSKPTLYLTRRVEAQKQFREDERLIRGRMEGGHNPRSGFAKLLAKARSKDDQGGQGTVDEHARPAGDPSTDGDPGHGDASQQ